MTQKVDQGDLKSHFLKMVDQEKPEYIQIKNNYGRNVSPQSLRHRLCGCFFELVFLRSIL